MNSIKNKIKQQQGKLSIGIFRNEKGAIDLASIMVGIIVIGLIGGVIAATVFSVIPWSQDNAAKQQLDSIASAESAYMGLSSADPSPLPAGYVPNSFGNSAQLKAANLLQAGPNYCAVTPADGKSYTGYSKSDSGTVWVMNDKNTRPVVLTDPVPAECGFTIPTAAPATPAPYVDPTPTLTSLTYRCDTTTSGNLPWQTSLIGKETWDDGSSVIIYNNASKNNSKTLMAGKTYKVTFDGTYRTFSESGSNLVGCLISMDHWGMNSGVVDASYGFYLTSKLTSVPAQIPTTITNMNNMFQSASAFNQDINSWDVSNVITMRQMFHAATIFNQPLNNWNVSNVTDLSYMFALTAFNQPLDKWNTSNAIYLNHMFYGATNFNQAIGTWNTSKAVSIEYMFKDASNFNQPIGSWNTGKVQIMNYTFQNASSFNQPIGSWNTASATTMVGMFNNATNFNQNIKPWNVSKVTASTNFRVGSALTAANSPF